MSLRVTPGNLNLMDILQPLIDEGKLKTVMNEQGEIIEDWGALNGRWQNTIGNLEDTGGYKINVNSPVTLEVTGSPTPLPFYILLNAGKTLSPGLRQMNKME